MIKLENELTLLLIHDPTTDKSAAALDCNVGAFNDPPTLPGLAHFLEHLLFMGTEKYPNENDYSSYLSQHSGHSNAYTSKLDTNYYFEINHQYLEGALDRFAQFFIHPLFNKNCKDREIKAVDSENKKNLQNDIWRLSQLDKALSNPEHPYHKFSTGNIETLGTIPVKNGIDVREELIKFYKEHYSSNLMRLVVLGREDLDTLNNWVVEKFSDVPNQSKLTPTFQLPPYTEKELTKIVKLKPVMNTRSLEITFTVPDQAPNWKTQPHRYFSHLIGHEGKGSLLFHLKHKGWATGLSAGSMNISKDYSVFSVGIDLTQKGLENYEAIVIHLFQYINMLQAEGPKEWIFNELKDVSALNFKFQQKSGASGTVSKLANLLNKMDDSLPEHLVLSQNVLREYDSKLIKDYCEHFNVENFKILIVSPTFDNLPLREKWYGTEYSIEDIPNDFLNALKSSSTIPELHLPLTNEFIPTNFDVEKKTVEVPLKVPSLVLSNDLQRVWYKKDDQFWVPKGTVSTMFHLPISQTTPLNSVLTTVYLELVDDYLNDIAYDASIVGLHFGLNPTRDGFTLKIVGYNDRLIVLLNKVVDTIKTFRPTEERFEIIKEKLLKEYKNFGYSVPYGQIGYYSTFLLYDQTWTIDEKITMLEDLQFDDVQNYIPLLFKQVFLETLVHGNFTKDAVLEVSQLYSSKFQSISKLSGSQQITGRSIMINDGAKYRYETQLKDDKNINSCIEYFVQLGSLSDLQKLTLADLLVQVSHEPCFNELRTKQQLGYVVFSGVQKTRNTFGYRVLIQSERTTDYLEYRIDDFLNKFAVKLASFTEEEFTKNVESLVAKKLLKIKNLNDEYGRFWSKIGSGFYDFNANELQVEILNKTTLEDLQTFFKEEILSNNNSKLVIHLQSQNPPEQDPRKLIDITISNSIPDLLSNKLEALVKSFEFKDFSEKSISEFINSEEFETLLESNDINRELLVKSILKDLLNPVPEEYPSGVLINSISEFKSENTLTSAAKPVISLANFMANEDLNGSAKL